MRRLKKLFWLIAIVLISNCIIVTPSFAEGEEQNNDTGQNGNIPEPGEIVQDYYDGDYTIEDIISKYNVVTFEDIEKFKHIVGPVLVEGDLGQEGETIYHTHKTDGVNSCIKGEVVANGNTTSSAYTNPTDIKLYVGEENTVEAYRASDNTNRELEVNEHYEATSYTVNGKPNYTQYMAVRTEDYFDFDKLKDNVIAEQANFAEGTTLTKNENNIIYVEAGSTYTIDSLEGVSEIRINNLQLNNNEQTTLINIKDNGEITMPIVTDGNGTQFSTNDYIGGVSNTMNLVWSIPNATKVVFGASAFVGHVIAPNAYVEKLAGNSAGCIICKNIQGEEIHYYPFNGRIEIPKKEKKYAFVSKVDEDSGDEVSDATIEIYDALGTLIDTWTTAGEPHKVENLTAGEIYTIKETVTPQGYKGSTEKTFKLDENGNIIVADTTATYLEDGTIIVKNKIITTSVTITKHSETLDGEKLPDTDYILYRTKTEDGTEKKEYYKGINENGVAEWSENRADATTKTTNNEGIAEFRGITITKSDLDNTNYFFEEVKAPSSYELDSTPVEVIINADNYEAGKAIAGADQANEKITLHVKITKIDEYTNESVVGAHLQVLDEEGNIIDEWDTTTEEHKVKRLEANKKYTLRETIAPQGYTASRDSIFVVNEDGTINRDETDAFITEDGMILVKNKPVTTEIKVTKKDEETGETLEDSQYALYRTKTEDGTIEYYMGKDENGIAMWSEDITKTILMTTNENGNAQFDGITIRKADLDDYEYYVVEKKAPEGYELNSTPIRVKMISSNYMDGVVFEEIEHFNKKIVIPKADPIEEKESVSVKTGDNVSTYIQIAAIALSIIIISSKVEVRFKSKM